jgi:hypothetical protein
MSSSNPPLLRIEGASPALEIAVFDSNFKQLARGVGGLEHELQPGLYELRFREGNEQQSQLLKMGEEDRPVKAPSFEIASPAPVSGTSSSHEYHQAPVVDASAEIRTACSGPGAASGGMIVMIRTLAAEAEQPFPDDVPRRFTVVDQQLRPVGERGRWEQDVDCGWALWRAALEPGGYALRFDDPASGPALLQSAWVDEDWQTLVFIPNTPQGPAPELATIHIARLGEWSPEAFASDSAIALESVLAGLRSRRSVVPGHLGRLFAAKFSNPFLGIAAAHALLLDPDRSLALLETVIGNLRRLIPGNPDVAALAHRAAAVGAAVDLDKGIGWPPIFYAGYRALLRADAADPGVIADGSPAEDAAALVRLSGIWTTWAEAPTHSGARGADAEVDPAVDRLLTYLQGAIKVSEGKDLKQVLGKRSIRQLALATGLSSSAARKAVATLKGQLQ